MNKWTAWMVAGMAAAALACAGCGRTDGGAADATAESLAKVVQTPEQEAQGAVEAAMAALKEGRADQVYAMLPESYRKDISEVVAAYAGKVDPDVLRMGVETLGAFGNALAKQAGNVLQLTQAQGLVPVQLDDDSAAALEEALTADNVRAVGEWLAKCGEWLNPEALRKGDLDGLLGSAAIGEFVKKAWAEGEAKGPLSVRLAGEAPESAGGVLLEMGSEENGFEPQELVKVDGCWVPKELADEWPEMVRQAMAGVADFSLDDETVQKAKKMLPALKRAMASWGDSETPEELMGNVMGTMMTLGAMGGF